ncbi:MAG: hypothetical protein PVG39_29270 [Desulfobacteraceae bacterium]|jgi:hypothetical protein
MLKSVKMLLGLTILFTLLTVPLLSGCKGSDTREKVDDTVEELAGKKKVDQMKKMEKDISDITDKQAERFDELDESGSEEE